MQDQCLTENYYSKNGTKKVSEPVYGEKEEKKTRVTKID